MHESNLRRKIKIKTKKNMRKERNYVRIKPTMKNNKSKNRKVKQKKKKKNIPLSGISTTDLNKDV
jgi:hypothetical protein